MNWCCTSEILKDCCCCFTDSVALDLCSSSCALQQSDLCLSGPSTAIVMFTANKKKCKFYNFSSGLVTEKRVTKELQCFLIKMEMEPSITWQSLACKDALTYQILSEKLIESIELCWKFYSNGNFQSGIYTVSYFICPGNNLKSEFRAVFGHHGWGAGRGRGVLEESAGDTWYNCGHTEHCRMPVERYLWSL